MMGLDETYQRSKRSRAAVYRTLTSWQSFIVAGWRLVCWA